MSLRRAATAFLLAGAVLTGTTVAGATNAGTTDGCTPGFWKNHTNAWLETPTQAIDPDTTLGTAFGITGDLSTVTFLEALSFRGGSDLRGASEILLRAATASYLNAAHEDLEFPLRRYSAGVNAEAPLVSAVQQALASGDRATITDLAQGLDAANNLGCPLGGDNTNAKSEGKAKK